MGNIKEIEGIGAAYAEKLLAAGINTEEELLKAGATSAGRKDIAEKTGVSEAKVLEWVNRADLSRVKGIGSEYADLLEAAGVDSVPELGQRNAANLHAKLKEINDAKNLVRQMPSETTVAGWVQEAGQLDRIVTH